MLFEHNKEVYEKMKKFLNENGKAILILGTCLGKTSTALEYVNEYKLNALVLCPNNTIKDGWNSYKNVKTITYQAFAKKFKEIDYNKIGIVICDEVHHVGAETWGKGIEYILENKLSKVLGLTATNLRTDGIDIAEKLFGDNITRGLTVLEGIEKEILNGMTYVNSFYSLDEIKEENSDLDDDLLRKELDLAINNTPEVKDILINNMPDGDRKGIIFVSDVEDIKLAENIYLSAFPDTEIKTLHSSKSNKENKETRDWFKTTSKGFIISQDMINEGAHYSGVNTLVMFRRTSSQLLYYQQIGRVLSLKKNGDNNAIIFDLVNNNNTVSLFKELQDDEEFKKECERQSNMSDSEMKEFENSIPKQIIIKDYVSKLSEVLKKIDDNWQDWEREIIEKYYETEGSVGCQKRIDEEWERRMNE